MRPFADFSCLQLCFENLGPGFGVALSVAYGRIRLGKKVQKLRLDFPNWRQRNLFFPPAYPAIPRGLRRSSGIFPGAGVIADIEIVVGAAL